MNNLLLVLMMLALAGTAVVLAIGVVGFLRGGAFNARYGNTLMRARVGLQLVAVLLLGLIFMLNG